MYPDSNSQTKSTLIRAEASVLKAWQGQLSEASNKPWLASLLLRRGQQVFQRFATFYKQLQTLPRRLRRLLTRRGAKLGTSLAGAALMLALTGAPILAGTITVDSTTCTLIDAITTANTDTNIGGCTISGTVGGADTIELPANSIINLTEVNNSYLGDNGLPVISSTVTIAGNESTIQRSNSITTPFRIMAVNSSGNLTLNDVTLTNGQVLTDTDGGGLLNTGTTIINDSTISGNSANDDGGGVSNYAISTPAIVTFNNSTISGNMAIDDGGGVHNFALNAPTTLTISNSTIISNMATGDGGDGAGVFSRAENQPTNVTITNSAITGNQAGDDGGGVYHSGRNAAAMLTITNSTIISNTAIGSGGNGGGININSWYDSTTGTVTNSVISGNMAGNDGGGVYHSGRNVTTTLMITNSTISNNATADEGGGLFNQARYGQATTTLNNSTISGNIATNRGGGISNLARDAQATIALNNSTLSGNMATNNGGGVYNYVSSSMATVDFNRSLVSGNSATSGQEIYNETTGTPGTITANNFNLFGHNGQTNLQAFANFTPTTPTDITATSDSSTPTALTSILDTTLQNNGGDTATHALISGSPAIDAVTDGSSPATDQRGISRPQGAHGDIGAFEFIYQLFLPVIVK